MEFTPPPRDPQVFVKRPNESGAWETVEPGTTLAEILGDGETGLLNGKSQSGDYVLRDNDAIVVKFTGHDNG